MAENRDLKVHCNRYHEKYHGLRDIHVKNQFRIQELEDSRDAIHEINQRQKINTNKYLDMIRKQNERIKQMEHSLKMHSLRGPRSSVESVAPDNSAEMEQIRAENEKLRDDCEKLQDELNESYNLIDELEFELETVSLKY